MSFRSLANDLEFGLAKEAEVIKRLSEFFQDDIMKTTEKFCKYDAYGKINKYEIKSRRNKKDAYPTTIIPVHKTIEGELIFVFNFIDGLYYIKYDDEKFSKYDQKDVGTYRYGAKYNPSPHYHIPVSDLSKIGE
jgi:hypothetical protein